MVKPQFETIDDAVIGKACLALAPDRTPWVGYIGDDQAPRVAARSESGEWQIDRIGGETAQQSARMCLEIDSEGEPHVAFIDQERVELRYGRRADGAWQVESVPTQIGLQRPGGVLDYAFRLHFRQDTPELHNTPHLVFFDPSTDSVGYARKVVLRPGDPPKFFLMALANGTEVDAMRRPSMSFDKSGGGFSVAFIQSRIGDDDGAPSQTTRIWSTFILDPLNGKVAQNKVLHQGAFNAFAQTSDFRNFGNRLVAYLDATAKTVNAITFPASDPVMRVVADAPTAVSPCATATSRGQFRIAFGDQSGVHLATQQILGDWELEVIDGIANAFPSPWLVYERIDPVAHMAYNAGGTLVYATWTEEI